MKQNIDQLQEQINTLKAERDAQVADQPQAAIEALNRQIIDLQNEITAQIVEGAKPCGVCGNPPHGLRQNAAVKNNPIFMFEIGCLHCNDTRVQDVTNAGAVTKWNQTYGAA